jgi:small conductance mechanosensitive channel
MENIYLSLGELIPHFISGILVLALFVVLRVIVYFVSKKLKSRANKVQSQVITFIVKFVAIFIWVMAFIYVLGAWGINISALVASLGLASFAIGLALKDSISNALSGALILFYHPFRLHDRIKFADIEGTVIGINMRYITVKDMGDEKLKHLVPNSKLLSEKITIVGK